MCSTHSLAMDFLVEFDRWQSNAGNRFLSIIFDFSFTSVRFDRFEVGRSVSINQIDWIAAFQFRSNVVHAFQTENDCNWMTIKLPKMIACFGYTHDKRLSRIKMRNGNFWLSERCSCRHRRFLFKNSFRFGRVLDGMTRAMLKSTFLHSREWEQLFEVYSRQFCCCRFSCSTFAVFVVLFFATFVEPTHSLPLEYNSYHMLGVFVCHFLRNIFTIEKATFAITQCRVVLPLTCRRKKKCL